MMVIPCEYADEVGYRFYKIQLNDQANRCTNYLKAGKELDGSVNYLPDIERWFCGNNLRRTSAMIDDVNAALQKG